MRAAPGRRSSWERWPGAAGGLEVFLAREPDASFHLHWHEEWSLGAIRAGACSFACDGRRAVARAGDLVLIPPRFVHTAGTSSLRFEMVMLYLPAEAVAGRLGLEPGLRPVLARFVWRRPAAVRQLLRAAATRDVPAVLAVLAAAHRCCRAGGPVADVPDVVDPRVAQVSRLLRAAPDDVPDVAALARAVGLSREHLHRLFHSALGLSPGQYLRLARLAAARRRIRAGERLADVAVACGFADQAHFSRWFRRTLGVTPRVYAAQVGPLLPRRRGHPG